VSLGWLGEGLDVSVGAMAKKKPGPKPDPTRTRNAVINVRSTEAWKQAVEEFADWDRAPSASDLVDRAVVSYARERGYGKAFPTR
jgi:hypothetical protein